MQNIITRCPEWWSFGQWSAMPSWTSRVMAAVARLQCRRVVVSGQSQRCTVWFNAQCYRPVYNTTALHALHLKTACLLQIVLRMVCGICDICDVAYENMTFNSGSITCSTVLRAGWLSYGKCDFRPLQLSPPWIDNNEIWHTWLRRRGHAPYKFLSTYSFRSAPWTGWNITYVSWLFLFVFPSTRPATTGIDRFLRSRRQMTSFRC